MGTIIEYTDSKLHNVDWPNRIISPSRASLCCTSSMNKVGLNTEHTLAGWKKGFGHVTEYEYRVCKVCGFAIRRIVKCEPDEKTKERLRYMFTRTLERHPKTAGEGGEDR